MGIQGGAGSYHLGAANPMEDSERDCRCPQDVVEVAGGNPPYVVGGNVYGVEACNGSARASLERGPGNTQADMAIDKDTGAVAGSSSPIGVAGHCRHGSDDWEIATEDL